MKSLPNNQCHLLCSNYIIIPWTVNTFCDRACNYKLDLSSACTLGGLSGKDSISDIILTESSWSESFIPGTGTAHTVSFHVIYTYTYTRNQLSFRSALRSMFSQYCRILHSALTSKCINCF